MVKGVIYIQKKHGRDLKISGIMGGGGGQQRGGIGGDDCTTDVDQALV